jgi:hypothetical protein
MHGMDEERISVARIEASKTGPSHIGGTFPGRLVNRDGEAPGRVTSGRFKADGAVALSIG